VNIDLKAMFDSLNENIRSLGGFSPEQVRQSGLLGDEAIRNLVLRSLKNGPKTGHELSAAVSELSGERIKPTPGRIYPLLESLLDEGLVSVSSKKDRKIYSLTQAGSEAEAKLENEPSGDHSETSNTWALPKWVDVRGVVPVAASRLAKVSLEVSQFGTKEQQELAAAAIDDARKRIHEILSEK
jgi:DNA-binding PadR family transcriptional regulator